MSRKASQKSKLFDIFDFADEDERVERESTEILGRFKKPKRCRKAPFPLNKYKFLQRFTRQNEISNRAIDLDLEVADCSRAKRKQISNRPIALDSEVTEPHFLQSRNTWEKKKFDGPIDVDAEEVQATKTAQKGSVTGRSVAGVTGQQSTFPANCPKNMREEEILDLDTPLWSFSSNYENERVGMILDDDNWIKMNSSSPSASSHVEYGDSPEEQLSVHDSDVHEIEKENLKVVISPDFMMCRGMYCTEGQLTFSKTFLKFEGLSVNGIKNKFSFIWTLGDIISIEAEWCEKVETAIMNLVLQSKNFGRAGNANETSVIESLKFSVYDPCWSERQEAIKSLSVRYKDIWNTLSDKNIENAFMGQNSSFHENFKEVIYPKGDPDAISISKRDVELLRPGTFINDTIIDFYIKYLKNNIQPEEQHRFYFFNSFFFCKLADLDKGLSSACQARAAFQRVHKWTRKVDIFEKDYIFVPVNYSLHWSLIVICHPGEVANFKDDASEKLLKVPCILHMDSIRGSHRGLKNLFQSYLSEEWKQRNREAADDVASKFLDLPFVPLELPQQENSFDCGIFLLHYVELFLLQAPTNFCPFKITRSSNFLNMNWFPPAEASLKRSHIKKLIYEILEEQSHSSTSADCIYKYSSSLLPDRSEQETGVQSIEQIGSSSETCHDHSSNSNIMEGSNKNSNIMEGSNNFAFSAASHTTVLQGLKASVLEIFDCYEVGICGGLLSHGNSQQINTLSQRNAMSPIEETEETSEEIAADSPPDLDGQQVAGSVTEPCLFMRYRRNDVRVLRTSWNQQKPLHFKDSAFNKSSDSLDSLAIVLEDTQPLPEFEVSSHVGETDKTVSSSTSNEGYSDCIVEDSQESSGMHDDIENACSPFYFHRGISALSHQQADLTAKFDLKENSILKSEGRR
ncbi:probable ubiquitin-like-specific protease 2A [Durio zibethinus]|uniref:Probable ubiquitin-like-specific protease 2A n=1 Tax=Durio zibethinus TaxID=66656 RepID=A0A6P5XC65_DURZI|nr:probable ubiquitin-like-specific protease 2A [Durio zibethinus]